MYGDPEHPARATSLIQSPAWTPEDRGLIAGLDIAEAELCRCGHPRSLAWHSDMDGDFDVTRYVCHACTALEGGDEKVKYAVVGTVRDFTVRPLPAFRLGFTTTDD